MRHELFRLERRNVAGFHSEHMIGTFFGLHSRRKVLPCMLKSQWNETPFVGLKRKTGTLGKQFFTQNPMRSVSMLQVESIAVLNDATHLDVRQVKRFCQVI